MKNHWLIGAFALALCGCGADGAEPPTPLATEVGTAEPAQCAPGDTRLPGSGWCEAAVMAKMPRPEKIFDESGQCHWVLAETGLPEGQWLLYRALACKEGALRLEYAGGAHQAELRAISSAFGPGSLGPDPWIIARLIPAQPDAATAIRNFARAADSDKAEAARCDVRKAGFEGWPADALVVDVSEAEAAKAPSDEPRTACGEYGLDEDTASFWRSVGPFAVYFNLGQETAQVDAGSFIVVQKAD